MSLPKWKAAYLAACIDTDGHVTINLERKPQNLSGWKFRCEVGVTNTSLKFLENIQEMYGNGNIGLRARKGTMAGSTKPCYQLRFSTSWLRKNLIFLIPYLVIKQEKAEIALDFLNDMERLGFGKGRSKSTEEWNQLLVHRNRLIALREKGAKHIHKGVEMKLRKYEGGGPRGQ